MLVVGHNIWEKHWRVLITILAWITLIKGILILNCPYSMREFSMHIMATPAAAYGAATVDFVLGCVLVYCGFRR